MDFNKNFRIESPEAKRVIDTFAKKKSICNFEPPYRRLRLIGCQSVLGHQAASLLGCLCFELLKIKKSNSF